MYHLFRINFNVNNYFIFSETFEFSVYRLPMNVTVTISEALAGVTFYYIAATDGNTRILPDFFGSVNFDTFSVVYMGSKTSTFAMGILRGTEIVDGSQVSFTMTVIGMLILLMGVVSIIIIRALKAAYAEERTLGDIMLMNTLVVQNPHHICVYKTYIVLYNLMLILISKVIKTNLICN